MPGLGQWLPSGPLSLALPSDPSTNALGRLTLLDHTHPAPTLEISEASSTQRVRFQVTPRKEVPFSEFSLIFLISPCTKPHSGTGRPLTSFQSLLFSLYEAEQASGQSTQQVIESS